MRLDCDRAWMQPTDDASPVRGTTGEVLGVAFWLGLTSFGGPTAHLGYFRKEYVERRQWLSDSAYAEIVAISQALPGPVSSKVGMSVGYVRAGWRGALAAWAAFTAPSAVAMAIFAIVAANTNPAGSGWVRALELVAVAVVLDAVLGMGRRLASTIRTGVLAVAAFAAILLVDGATVQLLTLLAAALVGVVLFRSAIGSEHPDLPIDLPRRVGAALLTAFALLLLAVPVIEQLGELGALAAATYRAGALVIGGGHVVLPLLQEPLVPALIDEDTFLVGFGAAQAVPGPLFTFATFIGQFVAGVPGALVATLCIFLPGALLQFGVLPFWAQVRANSPVQAALVGVNAAVVGVLAAALVDPLAVTALQRPLDAVVAAGLFVLLRFIGLPPWIVVLTALAASLLLY